MIFSQISSSDQFWLYPFPPYIFHMGCFMQIGQWSPREDAFEFWEAQSLYSIDSMTELTKSQLNCVQISLEDLGSIGRQENQSFSQNLSLHWIEENYFETRILYLYVVASFYNSGNIIQFFLHMTRTMLVMFLELYKFERFSLVRAINLVGNVTEIGNVTVSVLLLISRMSFI